MEEESLGVLLADFLDYDHDKFPYETSYISVLKAGLFPKEMKNWDSKDRIGALSIESIVDPSSFAV
jgi:DNA polymerase sigma